MRLAVFCFVILPCLSNIVNHCVDMVPTKFPFENYIILGEMFHLVEIKL